MVDAQLFMSAALGGLFVLIFDGLGTIIGCLIRRKRNKEKIID